MTSTLYSTHSHTYLWYFLTALSTHSSQLSLDPIICLPPSFALWCLRCVVLQIHFLEPVQMYCARLNDMYYWHVNLCFNLKADPIITISICSNPIIWILSESCLLLPLFCYDDNFLEKTSLLKCLIKFLFVQLCCIWKFSRNLAKSSIHFIGLPFILSPQISFKWIFYSTHTRIFLKEISESSYLTFLLLIFSALRFNLRFHFLY